MIRSRLTVMFLLLCTTLLTGVSPSAAEELKYKRSIETYAMPDVTLVTQNNKRV